MNMLPVALTLAALRWPMPAMTNPTVIELGSGPTVSRLDPSRDYILRLPATRKLGSTVILGGRNVAIVGGHLSVPRSDPQRRALYIRDTTGTVHIEGVLIDNVEGAEFDGIAIAAPQAVVQVERVRIEGLTGSRKTFHSDVIQPWGGVRELRVDQLTASSGYQGIQLPDRQGGGQTGPVRLSRVNLSYANQPSFSAAAEADRAKGGFLLWTIQGRYCERNTRIELQDFYIQQSPVRKKSDAVWPPADGTIPCGASFTPDGNALTLSRLPVTGLVRLGVPPEGDFVPAGSVGAAYRGQR